MKIFIIRFIVFIIGALTMLFEVAGIRILGPFLGTSIVVWTSLIGIIMAGLSLGYWLGGHFADRKPNLSLLSLILFFGLILVLITSFADQYILLRLHKYVGDFRLRSVLASILLFGLANIFFGMILPFAAKLDISMITSSGKRIGNIYALSTLGSILGIFTSGFYILPALGHFYSQLLIILILLVFMVSIIMIGRYYKQLILLLLPLIIVIMGFKFRGEKEYLDINTQYNRVIIRNTIDVQTEKEIKWLFINDERSSAMYLDDDELVFEVLKYYHLVRHYHPDFKRTMMIGGSGYAFPKDFLKKYPEASIDVVEIDPGLTEIARQHFNLREDPRLKIIHEDGRTYINKTDQKYDAIFLDAYKSVLTVPYQLTTIEAVKKIGEILNEDGIVLANLIGNYNDHDNLFLRAEIKTFETVFPYFQLFAVQDPEPKGEDINKYQNFILVASRTPLNDQIMSEDAQINTFLNHKVRKDFVLDVPVLTDEYAPVEYYTFKALK